MKLTELLKVLPFYKTTHSLDTLTVNQIQMNDEDVKHGDIFICICGLTFDGHDFAQNAVKNGAVAIITEKKLNIDSIPIIQVSDTIKALALLAHKYYDYPTKKFPLIG